MTSTEVLYKCELMHTAAIFDLDGTITKWGTYTPFIIFVARQSPPKFFYALPIIIAALLYKLRLVTRDRVKEFMLRAVLGGVQRSEVSAHAATFSKRCVRKGLRPGAMHAIARHRAAGDFLVLATASFDFYAKFIGEKLGFDTVVGTEAEWDAQDRLSGKIAGNNCRGHEKLRKIMRVFPDLREKFHIVAYSDHHVDMPLLRWAHRAVAVNPSGRLRSCAAREGFCIVDWNKIS